MKHYLTGFAAMHLAVVTIALADVAPSRAAAFSMLVLTLAGVPVLSAWIGAELGTLRARRRLFEPRLVRGWRSVGYGLLTASVGLIVTAVLLVWLDDDVPQAALVGSAACGVTFAATIILPRVRPGRCMHCGYDRRGAVGTAVCPECGVDEMSRVRVSRSRWRARRASDRYAWRSAVAARYDPSP